MAQPVNLVPNGSFEDTIDFGNGFFMPQLWNMKLGTPDYFTSWYKSPYDSRKTPKNYYGFQYPKDGESYIGFIIMNITSPEKREYIQIELQNTLKKDSLYYIVFWVNMPDSFHLACEEKNIAFTFSDTMVKSNFEVLDRLSPIQSSDSTWDTTNKTDWEKINKKFKAVGTEKYLIIGNFKSSNETNLKDIGEGGEKIVFKEQSYYFVDQIGLYKYSEIDTTLPPIDTNEIKTLVIPNIFTPNGDNINDKWLIKNDSLVMEVCIYDRWGNKIKEWSSPGKSWDGDGFPSGVYFYKVAYTEKEVEKVKTGTITLIR